MNKKLLIIAYVAERVLVDATPELIEEIRTNPTGMNLAPFVRDEEDTYLDYAETQEYNADEVKHIEVLYDARKKDAIALTAEDWADIYEALAITSNEALMDKIGPDGSEAATWGVEATWNK